jgi:hypothetical protein
MRLLSGPMRRLETFHARVIIYHSPTEPLSIYIFWSLKRLQFQLYTHYLDLRLLIHLQLPFLEFRLPHSILHEDNGASRSVKMPAALLGNNIPFWDKLAVRCERPRRGDGPGEEPEVRMAGGRRQLRALEKKALSRNTAGGDVAASHRRLIPHYQHPRITNTHHQSGTKSLETSCLAAHPVS